VKRFCVRPCDEPDGTRTWDVFDRQDGKTVSNHDTRQMARYDVEVLQARLILLGDR
jgi:hypothetical protein